MAEIGVSLGGGGYDEVDITARAGDVLQGKTTLDANGEITNGTIPLKSDSTNVTLTVSTTSKSYAAGYYPNAHGAQITVQNKTTTAGTTQTTVSPDANKVLNVVTVNPTPSQEKTGTAGTSLTSVSPDSGKLLSKVYINPTPSQSKIVSCSTSGQTILPDSGKLLSSVAITAIPAQHNDSGNKQLYNGRSTYSYEAGWYHNAHGAYVDVFSW